MPTLVFLMVVSLQVSPQISVEPIGEGAWRLTISATDETDPQRLATRLQGKAGALCGAAGYHFGRYRFQLDQLAPGQSRAADHPDTLTLVQDIGCGPGPAEPPPVAPMPPVTEADTATLNPELEAATDSWFQAIDEARYADAFAVVDPAMTGGQSQSEWMAGHAAARQAAGPVKSRQIGRLTWYSNPPGVPAGHYGAVDYVASRTSQDECGYLVWYRSAPGAPLRLTRQETTVLPHDLDAATRAAIRQQLCIIL